MPTKSREYFSSLPPISTASSSTPTKTTSDPKRRAAFKPPRPSAADGEATTSKARPATTAGNGVRKRAPAARKSSETAGKSRKSTAKAKAKAKPDKAIIISDADEDEDEEELEAEQRQSRRDTDRIPTDEDEKQSDPIDEFSEIEEEDSSLASAPHKARSTASTAKQKSMLDDGPPPIPAKLLTRLLYEGFEDKDMKIGKEAMAIFGKYVETFVREGLARAIAERQEEGGVSDGFVQVEDLEKVAAQLLLDF